MKKALLFLLLVLAYGESKSQNTLVLNVDSFYQPLQILDVSNVDTLIVNNNYSIIVYVKPISTDFDSASWFGDSSHFLNFNPCDFSIDSTSFDCQLLPDTVALDSLNNYAAWKYYNIPDCKTFVITHQFSPLYFILHKQNDCVVITQEAITNEADEILFFPNPSNGDLNVRIKTIGEYTLRMTNALGQVIYVKHILSELQTIDLSALNLETGMYFLDVFDEYQTRVAHEKWMYKKP